MLIITLPIIIAQIIIVLLFYDRYWYNISYYASNLIANEIKLLISSHEKNDLLAQNTLQDYFSFAYQYHQNMKLQNKQPKIKEELDIFKNILSAKIPRKNIVKLNRDNKIEVFFQFDDGVVHLIFASKLLINKTSYIFVIYLISLTLLLLCVSLLFAKKQIQTILTLANAVNAYGTGGYSNLNYQPAGASEIKRAGLAFIRMRERIERQINKRTQMLAGISHDLRTPLTRMKLQLALMDDNVEGKIELNQDIDHLERMIQSYIDFAHGEIDENIEKVDINLWIQDLINQRRSNKIKLIKTKLPCYINIKHISFSRAIDNLINNSLKFGTNILCSIINKNDLIHIIIEDDGNGINDEEKLLVFKPFYRSDKARNLNHEGNVGLGLAIVKEIVTKHKGKILLKNSLNLGGLLVEILLPSAAKKI